MPPEAAEVQRWLVKADHDRIGAQAALACDPPITDVAAFHCQQAVEKTLKAYLVWREEEFERTHDLVELLAICAKLDPSFADLQPQVAPLTPYAVRFRYPGPADPSADEVGRALAVVRDAWNFVLHHLPEDVRP